MWIGISLLSVSVFMILSSRVYKKIQPDIKLISTELVLNPFQLKITLLSSSSHNPIVPKLSNCFPNQVPISAKTKSVPRGLGLIMKLCRQSFGLGLTLIYSSSLDFFLIFFLALKYLTSEKNIQDTQKGGQGQAT